MITRKAFILLFAILVLLGTASIVQGRTWHVPTYAPTIQAGIDSAVAGDVVEVACGEYHEFMIFMKSGVTLRSATGDPECVVIDAGGKDRVLYCSELDANTSIEGFTITSGAAYDGGGIYCTLGTKMTISNCSITGNNAEWSAGMKCVLGSAPTISHCVFSFNVAERNCGGLTCSNSSPTVTNCTFYANSSTMTAGAVLCQNNANPVFEDCIFAGNICSGVGAVIYCISGSDATLFGCNVYDRMIPHHTDCILGQIGINGNFSAEPGFCDAEAGDLSLCADSWCLPGTLPNGQEHGLIGALGQGCGDCGPHVPTERSSWGGVKSMYR